MNITNVHSNIIGGISSFQNGLMTFLAQMIQFCKIFSQ